MKALYRFAAEVQAFCQSKNWKFCFIGGIAAQRWAEPRLTVDVDLTLLTGFGHEELFIDPLLATFSGRIENARAFALQHRVLLLRSEDGIGVDVALGGLPFEERAIERATDFEFLPGLKLCTCSAEDLIRAQGFRFPAAGLA
jgi:hypothetical protein